MAMANLASSLGWKFMMPSGIQRRAPFTPLPMKGTSVRISRASVVANSQGAHFSQVAIGICSVTTAATKATATKADWRTRK
jgi:hypothetical protein